jgi:hypothetical protein
MLRWWPFPASMSILRQKFFRPLKLLPRLPCLLPEIFAELSDCPLIHPHLSVCDFVRSRCDNSSFRPKTFRPHPALRKFQFSVRFQRLRVSVFGVLTRHRSHSWLCPVHYWRRRKIEHARGLFGCNRLLKRAFLFVFAATGDQN